MIADPVTHYVLDAILLVLAIIRYLWGSLTNLTRLGIVVCFLELSIANMDSYYRMIQPDFSPGGPAPRILGKMLLLIFIVADLVRDYIFGNYENDLAGWARSKRRVRK